MTLLADVIIPAAKKQFLPSKSNVEAILVVGSTAFAKKFTDWDDFDFQIYTQDEPTQDSHYEILEDSKGRHYLMSAYFMRLDSTKNPVRNVMQQKDIRVVFGSKESLSHIFVERPRRIEPLRKEIPRFGGSTEVFFNILVDIFFILKRYEARGRPNSTKPRVARDGLRTICRHFYLYYGVDHPIPNRAHWRKTTREIASFLNQNGYPSTCENTRFAESAIALMLVAS